MHSSKSTTSAKPYCNNPAYNVKSAAIEANRLTIGMQFRPMSLPDAIVHGKDAIFDESAMVCDNLHCSITANVVEKGDRNGTSAKAGTNQCPSGLMVDACQGVFKYQNTGACPAANDQDAGTDTPAVGEGREATRSGLATRAEVAHLLFLALTPDFYGDLTNARSVRPLCLYTVQSVCDDLELDLPPEVESAFLSQLMDVAHEAIEARFETMDWRF